MIPYNKQKRQGEINIPKILKKNSQNTLNKFNVKRNTRMIKYVFKTKYIKGRDYKKIWTNTSIVKTNKS